MNKINRFVSVPALLFLVAVWWSLGSLFFGRACGPLVSVLFIFACLPLAYASAWAVRRLPAWIAAVAVVLLFPGLSTRFLLSIEANVSGSSCLVGVLSPFFLLSLGLITTALLLARFASVRFPPQPAAEDALTAQPRRYSSGLIFLLLALLALARTIHTSYWLMVWDKTVDPLGYLWLMPTFMGALVAGVLLVILLPGRAKFAGLAFPFLIAALLYATATLAMQVNTRRLTEQRAEHITRAIQAYQARMGRYPQSLRQLVPWYTLSTPEPVSIPTLDWCYDSGDQYYRLAYISRKHWSDPNLFGVVYSSAGELANLPQVCGQEISAYQARMNRPPAPILGNIDISGALALGVIPAFGVVIAAILLRRRGPDESTPRRMFLFFEITALVLLALVSITPFIPAPYQFQARLLSAFLLPAIFGLLIILTVSLPLFARLARREKILAGVLGLLILAALGYCLREPGTLFEVLIPGLVTLAAAWLLSQRPSRWVWIIAILAAVLLAAVNSPGSAQMTGLPRPVQVVVGILYASSPALAVVGAALLLFTGLQLASPLFARPSDHLTRGGQIEGILRMVAALLLVGGLVSATAWASIWDQTTDGLGGLFLNTVSTPVAIVCGMVMTLRAKGRARLVGVVFAILVPILVSIGFRYGWDVSFPQLTEQRAAQVGQALARFYQREGRYPSQLSELAPRDLLRVPRPVMFRGEDWCYQTDGTAYRLAAFSHEYFGLPVSLPVYQSAGSLGERPLPCAERLAGMQARYDWTRGQVMEPPSPAATPAPLLAGQARETLAPIFPSQGQLLSGTWSPDSRYWTFRAPTADNQVQLHVYDAKKNVVCAMPQKTAYSAYYDNIPTAWLPGNRLLYLDVGADPSGDADGILEILEPCGEKVGQVQGVKGIQLTRGFNAKPSGERVLLQTKDAFFILQPGAGSVQQIDGVQPTPYEAHSDSTAWSPGGARLAIARLNSREPRDGITLFLVDGATAQVITSLKLALASEQSAPFVEWLRDDQLLVHGPGAMLLLDFSTSPPRQVNVIKDLFHLNLAYPDQVSSMSSIRSRDGSGYHILLWANLPDDKQLYIYHSENGQLSAIRPRNPVVLIFPDGQSERMMQLEEGNPTADQVELDWVDSERASLSIAINGHLPRGYPMLDVRFLTEANRLLLSSSNGVSLVSVPDGELLHFWKTGSGHDTAPWLNLSPDGEHALFPVRWDGLFQIPLEK